MTPRTSTVAILTAMILGAILLKATGGTTAAAEDFRVDNLIFQDNEKKPHAESTTIFCAGLVYDYLKSPSEITVFDKDNRRFVLLDQTRRVKTEVGLDKVTALCEHLKAWAAGQTDPLLRFLADPTFDERYQADSGTLMMSSPLVTYELTTIPAGNAVISRQYREFCDWQCQLNTLLNPGSAPPFARMVVNEALDTRQLLPREVQRTVQSGTGFPARRSTVRSQHRVADRLAESDRDRVAQTGQYMEIFRSVPFDEYQKKVAP